MSDEARTGQVLAERFEELAAGAPRLVPDADLWRRGRRAHRRGVVAGTVAAVLVVVGLGAGAGVLLRGPDGVQVAGGEGLAALPTVLHAPPEHLTTFDEVGSYRWDDDAATSELALGRAVAAWTTRERLPVVVDALDGEHQLVDLPGWGGEVATASLRRPALALSPDGRSLAYSYAIVGPDALTEPIPSGVRVLDLEDGSLVTAPILGEEGTAVTALAWSPDGDGLAWAGQQLGSWTPASSGQATPVAGRLDPVSGDSRGTTLDGRATQRAAFGDGVLTLDDAGRMGVAPVRGTDQPVPLGTLRDGSTLVRGPERGEDDSERPLVVTGPGAVDRDVAVLRDGSALSLTVAVALLDPDRPSVERPAPGWPWSDERKGLVGSLAVVALVFGGIAARRRWERGRRV